jgi:nucleotide-binding universal stress UspA family protein
MLKLIVVPLDGTEIGEYALAPALGLARRHKAAVRLVRVYVPVAGTFGERGASYDVALDRTLMECAEDYLTRMVERHSEEMNGAISGRLLEGAVADAIDRHATSVDADLVVMTTQGRGPFVRFWLGSVADSLARQSQIPILFVRPREDGRPMQHDDTFKHVLIPLDGSELAERAVDGALGIDAGGPVRYTLLRVAPTLTMTTALAASSQGGAVPESMYRALEAAREQHRTLAEAYLAKISERLRAQTKDVETRVVADDTPADAILHDADARKVDLIAMTSRGHGGVKRMFLGSVADKVLRGSTTPVLLCRPVRNSETETDEGGKEFQRSVRQS